MLDRPTEAQLHVLADALPASDSDLLRAGRDAIMAYDAAIIAEAEMNADAARARYEAVLWKLNGRTYFASYGSGDAAGYRLAEFCAAAPGEPGRWGQACEFSVEAKGMHAILEARGGFSLGGGLSFNVHPEHMDAPFISETGYLSYMSPGIIFGAALPEAASIWLASLMRDKKPKIMPADAYARRCPSKRSWVGAPRPKVGVGSDLMAFPF